MKTTLRFLAQRPVFTGTVGLKLSFLLALVAGVAAAETPALFGKLEPGPHPVGFRTLELRDNSRPPIPVEGVEFKATDGRYQPLHVWYPASGATGPVLNLGAYVDLLAFNFDSRPPDEARLARARQRFVSGLGSIGGKREEHVAALPRLLALPGLARRDAPPATGRFPVVLFPDYNAPASNSVMAEYFASHGYVVVSGQMRSWREEEWMTGTPQNFESYVRDLEFALGALQQFAPADLGRVAAMGNGISANAVAALQMRSPLVQAHVSLDGSIISPTERYILSRSPYFDAHALRGQMLFIWSPHPNLVPALMDEYKYASRLKLHLPGMTEFRYLNYGAIEAMSPGLFGSPPGDTAAGFAWAARYVRTFLDAQLKADDRARTFLAATPVQNGAPAGLIEHDFTPALPAPPPAVEIRRLISAGGAAAFTTMYDAAKAGNPQPFSAPFLLELGLWAGRDNRDPDASLRKTIALARIDSFPESARAHLSLAGAAVQRGERDLARRHYQEGLRLLANDPDPSMDESWRRLLRQRTEDSLRRLDTP